MSPHLRLLLGAVLAVSGVAGACASDHEPPSTEVWRQRFDDVVALVPSRPDLSDAEDPEEACGEAVGRLRNQRELLFPAPDADLERAATEWIDLAEGLVFDCPDGDELDDRYDELNEATIEVEELLGR